MGSESNRLQGSSDFHHNGNGRSSVPLLNAVSDDLNKLSDAELIDYLKSGSPDPIAILFARYRHLVFSISMKILRDVAEAEDVVQDVFLEIWEKADRFDPARGTVKVWVLQYAYSRSLDRRRALVLRQTNEHGQNGEGNHWKVEPLYVPDVEEKLTIHTQLGRITEVFGALSPKQRETLELIYFHGLMIKEVVDRTGESADNVRNHHYRGLKKLREVLMGVRAQDGN